MRWIGCYGLIGLVIKFAILHKCLGYIPEAHGHKPHIGSSEQSDSDSSHDGPVALDDQTKCDHDKRGDAGRGGEDVLLHNDFGL